jgi:hypothetical protein
MAAVHRFSNVLRYRAEDYEAQCQLTPSYVLGPVRASLGGVIGLDTCTTAGNPAGAARFYAPPAKFVSVAGRERVGLTRKVMAIDWTNREELAERFRRTSPGGSGEQLSGPCNGRGPG